MRKKRERMYVLPVDRWKRRRAPDARVDPFVPERPDEGQRTVDASVPEHPPVEELLGVMRHQPAFALAVADLLTPVGFDRGTMVMPDERRRGEADLPAARL